MRDGKMKSLVLVDLCGLDKKKYNRAKEHNMFLKDLASKDAYSSGRVAGLIRDYANFGLVLNSDHGREDLIRGLPLDFLILKKHASIYFPSNGWFTKESSDVMRGGVTDFDGLFNEVSNYFSDSFNGGLVVIGSKKRNLPLMNDAYSIADCVCNEEVVSLASKNGFVNRQSDVGGFRNMLAGAYDFVRSYDHRLFLNSLKKN